MSEYSKKIDHSDRIRSKGLEKDFIADYSSTRENLRRVFPEREEIHETYSNAMARLLQGERQRRSGHYFIYKMQTGVAHSKPLFNTDLYLPERSLLDIEQRTTSLSAEKLTEAKIYGKAISIELGHIDQFGDWSAAHPLDVEMRNLPDSPVLSRAGFEFADTYADKTSAKVSYRFHTVTDDKGKEVAMRATRRRAAADIITRAGTVYEVVKSSSFLINGAELSDEHREAIDDVVSSVKSTEHPDAVQFAGEAIVEPYIGDKELQEQAISVLAATSLYFALRRD